MKSSYANTSSIRDEWYCWKSGTQNKRRDVCCVVAIRLGWKMVCRFCGMQLFPAKSPRLGSWEKHLMNCDFEIHSKVWSLCLVHWRNIIPFPRKTSQGSANLLRKCYLEYSPDMYCSSRWFGKEILRMQTFEELENLDAAEIRVRRLSAKEIMASKKCEPFVFPIAEE